jgi:adiponectin receptor
MHLLSRAEVPDWCEPSPFILSGYRSPSHSWAASLASWSYCHNETGNIFSHLLPSLVLALGGLLIGFDLSSPDEAAVALHLVSAILCLSLSTLYHTGLNHSPSVAYRWLQLDYGGILALILGNFISGVHFGFYCDPALKMLYWSLVSSKDCVSLNFGVRSDSLDRSLLLVVAPAWSF